MRFQGWILVEGQVSDVVRVAWYMISFWYWKFQMSLDAPLGFELVGCIHIVQVLFEVYIVVRVRYTCGAAFSQLDN